MKIVILGGGESGYGSAVLAKSQGHETFLSDAGNIAEKYREKLDCAGIEFEAGGHTPEKILDAEIIIKSPGIPDKAPMVVAAHEKGIPVISEIEFAGEYTNAKTICITGSNGKTTTTTLIYEILSNAGFNVGVGGNIGDSFALQVACGGYEWYVLELSSFQLDGTFTFRPDISVLMNITPDHLDRYDYDMELYTASKFRIIRNQTASDSFIYCADDTVITTHLPENPVMKLLPFSVKVNTAAEGTSSDRPAAFPDGETMVANANGLEVRVPVSELGIRGIHNVYNCMAAALAALSAGVEPEAIAQTLRTFQGVEHRLEPVASIEGAEYINDSKATNTDAAWYALESMTKPVVWIAGGTDKGNDYATLKGIAAEKVKALVCMGADNSKLLRAFEGVIPQIASTSSLEDAMSAAKIFANKGDVVLLSPACASFDLFKNYEDRGRQFKEWVKRRQDKNSDE